MSGGTIHLGTVAATFDTAALDRAVARAQVVAGRAAELMPGWERAAFLRRASPLTFAEFQAAADERPRGFAPSAEGWLSYLRRDYPEIAKELPDPPPAGRFAEHVRQRHTLVVAGNGSGKSTLLKTLVHHYVANTDSGVLVLDPHADMAREIAMWPEFSGSDRLVYITADLFPGMAVGLNPLDGRGMDLEARNDAAEGFAELFGEFTGELTANMTLVAHYCAEVLLGMEGATLADLARMVQVPDKPRRGEERAALPPATKRLFERARTHPRQGVREFFTDVFDRDALAVTRNTLSIRLRNVMKSMPVEAMLTGGPATFDLAAALNGGKVVVVDLLSFGERSARPVGLLFLAMLTSMAFGRKRQPVAQRRTVHLFVDEIASMGGPALVRVVNELRKFGVHATLAQQTGGQGFERADLKDALFNSTAIKILASDRPHQFAKLAGIDFAKVPPLDEHEFWVKWGETQEVVKVKTDARFSGSRHQAAPQAWAATLDSQKARYYRPSYAETVSAVPELGEALPAPAQLMPASIAANANDVPPRPSEGAQGRWKRLREVPELE